MIHIDSSTFAIRHTDKNRKVLVLGDQLMNLNEQVQNIPVEKWHHDYDIVTVDINEKAMLTLDLCRRQKELDGKFGTVWDHGTIEHVEDLYRGLQNVFEALEIGGVAIHVNPLTGNFPGHNSYHYFTTEFWREYCKLLNVKLLTTYTHAAYHNWDTGVEVYAAYEKTEHSKFPIGKSRLNFDKIYNEYISKS